MPIKKDDRRIFIPAGADIPKMQPTNPIKEGRTVFCDSASIPKMQAVKSGGEKPIVKGAPVPKMAPAPAPVNQSKSDTQRTSNSQTTNSKGDKKT